MFSHRTAYEFMADLIFAGVLAQRRTSFPAHTHEHWELICYIEGTGVLTVGDQRILFKPGTIVAQPPNVPHDEVAPGGYRCIFVGMHAPLKGRGIAHSGQQPPPGPALITFGNALRRCYKSDRDARIDASGREFQL